MISALINKSYHYQMKKITLLIVILCINFLNAQENLTQKSPLKITLDRVFYNFAAFGTQKIKFGEDIKNPEKLKDVYIIVKIEGYDIDNPIDFNCFSLVENELKIRQRPFEVSFDNFNNWQLNRINLKDFPYEDTFLKYSQEGITNFDHFYIQENNYKKNESFQHRFPVLSLSPKKNKDNEFLMRYPVRTNDGGEFSLYYKDSIVKTFYLKPGEKLKFKNQ